MKCSKCNNKARKPYDLCDNCMQREIEIEKENLCNKCYNKLYPDVEEM